jgi:hypothetical protein
MLALGTSTLAQLLRSDQGSLCLLHSGPLMNTDFNVGLISMIPMDVQILHISGEFHYKMYGVFEH